MFQDQLSKAVIDFSDSFIKRVLGNCDSQRLVTDSLPSDKFNTGMLFPASESDSNRRNFEYKSKVAPSSCKVQFRVQGELKDISITPSFTLYFRAKAPLKGKVLQDLRGLADEIKEDEIWKDWRERLSQSPVNGTHSSQSAPAPEKGEAQSQTVFIRKRYAKTFRLSLENNFVELDLADFRESYKSLGDSPNWQGSIAVNSEIREDGASLVSIILANTYSGKSRAAGESNWFDVRIKIGLKENSLMDFKCPVLDDYNVEAFSANISFDKELSTEKELIFTPIAKSKTQMEEPRKGPTFKEAAEAPGEAIDSVISILEKAGASDAHISFLKECAEEIKRSPQGMGAFKKVSEVYGRCFGKEVPWYCHQLVTLLVAASCYLKGKMDLQPIVLNIPTAGGKTESFLSAAMWAIFFEKQKGSKSINIIKYPVTLLSSDQARRLAGYSIVLDEILGEPAGIGYFVGKKGAYESPKDIISKCPRPISGRGVCNSEWKEEKKFCAGASQLICEKGHRLTLGIGDEIFFQVPSFLIATWDKFIARSMQQKLRNLLGIEAYFCPNHGYMLGNRCPDCKRDLSNSKQVVKPGILILDEGHLIRGPEGTLNSHIETDYAEIFKANTGVYPIPIVSTATIAYIKRHMFQLGFVGKGESIILPPQKESRAYYIEKSELKHITLALLPQDRPLTWAIPDLCNIYFETLAEIYGFDISHVNINHPLYSISQIMIYCSSYKNINTLQEMIKNAINPKRVQRGSPPLRYVELSGRHFEEEKVASVVEKIKNRQQELIYATNIASIGIDIENLNSIFFFGLPSNVSEFIQTLNRTGRRKPAFCLAVLGPNKDRDVSYYTYWSPFVHTADKILEGIPLNRFARTAIDQTFNNIVVSLLLFHFGPKMGQDFRWCNRVRDALESGFPEKEMLGILKRIYRSQDDGSGAYEEKIEDFWEYFKEAVKENPSSFITDPFKSQGKFRYSLRNIQPQVEVKYNSAVEAAKRAGLAKINVKEAPVDEETEVEREETGEDEDLEELKK